MTHETFCSLNESAMCYFCNKNALSKRLIIIKEGLALKVLSKLLYAIADNKGNNEELKILHQKILNESLNLNELASDSGNDTFRIEEIPWDRLLDAITNTNPTLKVFINLNLGSRLMR